jgi:hypothetical protein
MDPREMSVIRNKRLKAAYNLEKPDRIPINLSGHGYFKWIDPTAVMADIFRRPEYIDDLTLQAYRLPIIEEIDSGPMMVNETGLKAFAAKFFARVKLPGKELPEDALWNFDEQGPMTEEDYDTVIDKGWEYMTRELYRRIGYDPESVTPPDIEYMKERNRKIAGLGKADFGFGSTQIPFPCFEVLSAARKLTNFIRDLYRIPGKVRAVLDIMEESAVEKTKDALKADVLPPSMFIGGTRAGSDYISPRIYEKFYHTFYQKIIPLIYEAGSKAHLHNDSDWSGFLKYFREFPRCSCVWDPDHMTPVEKAKETVGDLMCIEGNIPPSLIAVGTPD